MSESKKAKIAFVDGVNGEHNKLKKSQTSSTALPSNRRPTLRELNKNGDGDLMKIDLALDVENNENLSTATRSNEDAKLLERRRMMLNELFKTEATYVEYLQVAISIFLRPLCTPIPGKEPLMNADKCEQVFQNIEEILEINASLLKKMAIRKAQYGNIGDENWIDLLTESFSQPNFKTAYQKYIHGYNFANDTLAQITKRGGKNTSLGNWLQTQLNKNSDLCRGLASLPAFLISPVQRLPRYLLLLRDLSKCTPESHPDYPNIQTAYSILSAIMDTIDKGKLRYDEIYHLDALYQRFPVSDRANLSEMTDVNCSLVTEGPILEFNAAEQNSQAALRYLIVLNNMIICAKKRKQTLHLRWKVDLYQCIITAVEQNPSSIGESSVGPYFLISEHKKLVEYPFTVENVRTLQTFTEEGCEFNFAFWTKYFAEVSSNLLSLHHLLHQANLTVSQLQPQILSKRDWDLLAVGAVIEHMDKGKVVLEKGSVVAHLYYLTSGRCSIDGSPTYNEGDFFGEAVYLKMIDQAAAAVVVESERATITKISFDRLTSMLSGNADLASRFFRLLSLVAARNYVRVASRSNMLDGEDMNDDDDEQPSSNPGSVILSSTNTPTRGRKINPALVKLKLEEIAPDEEILQEYSCKLKNSKFSGQFYVMKEYIGFYSAVLGKKTRMVVPGRSVTEVVARDDYCIYINHLKHNVPPFELQFKTKAEKGEAYTILASFLSDKKRSLAAKTGVNYTAPGQARRGSIFNILQAQWDALVVQSKEYTVQPGQAIIAQGSMDDTVYQIIEGKTRSEIVNEVTKETTITGYQNVGEIFGEISFVLGVVSPVNYVAETEVVVLALRRTDIETYLQNQAEFAIAFYKLVAKTIISRLLRLAAKEDTEVNIPVAPLCEKTNENHVRMPISKRSDLVPGSSLSHNLASNSPTTPAPIHSESPLAKRPATLVQVNSLPNPKLQHGELIPSNTGDSDLGALADGNDRTHSRQELKVKKDDSAPGWLVAKQRSPSIIRKPRILTPGRSSNLSSSTPPE